MGWSCSQKSSQTMDKWTAACLKSTGSQNTYKNRGETYFFENSRREYEDGAITGTIWRFLPNDTHVRKSSSFRINGDGSIERAPSFLKKCVA